MSKLSMTGAGEVSAIADMLQREITESAMSCELVERADRFAPEMKAILLVFDKYYMRTDNRTSLSVMVSGGGGVVNVDAAGSGGGQGALFRFNWGAEEDFVDVVRDILSRRGFS